MNNLVLRKSFIHLDGVGALTERKLWSEGILDWDHLRGAASRYFKGRRLDGVLRALDVSDDALARRDLLHFQRALPSAERWRLIPHVDDDIAYFDIESTGTGHPPLSQSTVIAFYFRGEVHQEHDFTRKRMLLERMLDEARLFCTFNGAAFDMPFVSSEFRLSMAVPHLDLCPWLRRLGLRGGLKAVQRALPHVHQRSSFDIDGLDAVVLWSMHEAGEAGALSTLMTYNAEDVVVLASLLAEGFNREVVARPALALAPLVAPSPPRLATTVDLRVYDKLRAVRGYGVAPRFAPVV